MPADQTTFLLTSPRSSPLLRPHHIEITRNGTLSLSDGILRSWIDDSPIREVYVGTRGLFSSGEWIGVGEDTLMLLNEKFIMMGDVSAERIVDGAGLSKRGKPGILNLVARGTSPVVLAGRMEGEIMSFSSVAMAEIIIGEDGKFDVGHSVAVEIDSEANAKILSSSLKIITTGDDIFMAGISANGFGVVLCRFDKTGKGKGRSVNMDALHPNWRRVESIQMDHGYLKIAGVDDRYPIPRRMESLFLLDETDRKPSIRRVHGGIEDIQQDALVYCPKMNIIVAAMGNGPTVARAYFLSSTLWSERSVQGDPVIIPSIRGGSSAGLVEDAHLLKCDSNSMTVVFAARGGMTVAIEFTSKEGSVHAKQLWSEEEALGYVSSAVFVDETHSIDANAPVNADDEEEMAIRNLQFSQRMQSQLSSLRHLLSGSLFSSPLLSDEKAERDRAFGFAKIAVLLSETKHRIIGLDITQKAVTWGMNLSPSGSWHKIVHGGQFSSLVDPHGYGGVHDREMLALTYIPSASPKIEWTCFDGVAGKIFSNDFVSVSSGVAQVVPLRSHHPAHGEGCRQVVLIVHEDQRVSVVPNTPRSHRVVEEVLSAAGRNGFFVHTVDRVGGEFRAMRVTRRGETELDQYELTTVGTTLFDPSRESIINVAYPPRGEAIQSPSTVLGDDSLLLKYLNPHLVVVVTEATPAFLEELSSPSPEANVTRANSFYDQLTANDGSSSPGQKRKPLGASKPGENPPTASNTITPSLFVTLVDSVSGQILHRVSHSHAAQSDLVDHAPANVPVAISENWVVYAFFNQRTRRTDVGVLTLHEGMIDKNGLTAFNSPEQELTFSSLESAKPIVLSKTYGMAKTVTALGATVTKAGISSKQFLFATGNDQVIAMDRRMLDPRRPNGELKQSEMMEGLMRYSPLLPIIPLQTASHEYQVSQVQFIASTAANVESQSLVLAYGGPDIFFARLAPSKGFDLLPDDFNRGLLTAVLLGMVALLVTIQQLNKKKMVTTIWA